MEQRMKQLEALRQKREALRPAMEELEELGDELADEKELQVSGFVMSSGRFP